MGLVRILLPLPRAAARWAPEKGGPLLGAALSYCATPSWAGLPPPSPARRLAWAEEAITAYATTPDTEGLTRAMALRAHALLLLGRYEEAYAAAGEVAGGRRAEALGAGQAADGRGLRVPGAGQAADGRGVQVSGADEVASVRGARVPGANEVVGGRGAQAREVAEEVTAVRDVQACGASEEAAAVRARGGADEVVAGRGAQAGASSGGVVEVAGGVSVAVVAFVGDVRAQALAGVGRGAEAVEVARASVAAYRRLPAPDRRDRALGSLPGALRTYGMLLAEVGRHEESVAVYEECAALLAAMSLRELAHVELVRPQVLAELVGVLRVLGRYGDALGVGPEAREALRGPLAWTVPEIVLPLRVRLLVDLARCHTATGDPAEARACAAAAVTEARKPHGTTELASALSCLADVLAELGQTDKESITRRELAELRDT
ncbi:hypothetical protein ACFXPN_00470 [Streptomyces griseorubiginosus]|uniref:hypothetical protein n=1 Tax=Streptomyces griseorubiginosus TaxID=67304 RepID=UPI0036ABFD15